MDGNNTPELDKLQTAGEFKPGDTISPNQEVASPPPVAPTPPVGETPQPGQVAPAPASVPPIADSIPLLEEPEGEPQTPQPRMQSTDESITWTASEFIAHHKSSGWYGAVVGSAVVLAAVVFLLTRDKISTAVVVVGALVFAAYAARQPRQIEYRLDGAGLSIGGRYHAFDELRSFYVVQEGAFSSITFLPLKRFAPLVTIYYDPADEEKIITLLSQSLPMERRGHDAIDNFMRRIRF